MGGRREMTTNSPEFEPRRGEAINGPRDDLDPLREAELVADDGAAHLGLGATLQHSGAVPASDADADEDGERLDAG